MKQLTGKVTENTLIAENVFKMRLEFNSLLPKIKAGQFLNVSTGDKTHLLKRPFGIIEHTDKAVTFCYQLKGGGTTALSKAQKGSFLDALLPLGNGFDIKESDKKIALIGGGIGVFPLISVIKNYPDRIIHSYFGYKSRSNICLGADIDSDQKVVFSTDDGSYSIKGNAVGCFLDSGINDYDLILACGPPNMLKYLKQAFNERNISTRTLVSLEERMACGVGACLVCTCGLENGKNARVCMDGPVFDMREVTI